MGIAVKELLTLEYFKDYHVIAGKSGLHIEIQGTSLLDAPDALRVAKGKENNAITIPTSERDDVKPAKYIEKGEHRSRADDGAQVAYKLGRLDAGNRNYERRERRDERQRDDIAHTELDVPSMPDAPHPVGVEQDVERDAGYDKIEHRRATVQLAHDRSRDEGLYVEKV